MRAGRDLSELEGYRRRRLWAWPAAAFTSVAMLVLFIAGIWVDARLAATGAVLIPAVVVLVAFGVDFSEW